MPSWLSSYLQAGTERAALSGFQLVQPPQNQKLRTSSGCSMCTFYVNPMSYSLAQSHFHNLQTSETFLVLRMTADPYIAISECKQAGSPCNMSFMCRKRTAFPTSSSFTLPIQGHMNKRHAHHELGSTMVHLRPPRHHVHETCPKTKSSTPASKCCSPVTSAVAWGPDARPYYQRRWPPDTSPGKALTIAKPGQCKTFGYARIGKKTARPGIRNRILNGGRGCVQGSYPLAALHGWMEY